MAEYVIAAGGNLQVRQEEGVQHFGGRKVLLAFGDLIVDDFAGFVMRVNAAYQRFTLTAKFLILRLCNFFHSLSFFIEVIHVFSRQVQRSGGGGQ